MESSKPNILVLTDWFVPGYKAGGPIQSVNNLVNALESAADFSILTGDKDLMSDVPYEGVSLDTWTDHAQHRRLYTTLERRGELLTKELANDRYDFIYFNSFFSSGFTIKPLFALRKLKLLHKVILAPRGMLGKGALSVKPWKKMAYITLFKMLGMHKQVHFHSTDETETKDIRAALGDKVKISTLPNFPVTPTREPKTGRTSEGTNFIYASRISPKKNTLFLLGVMQDLLDESMKLDLYGTVDDDTYFVGCDAIISEHEEFQVHEAIPPSELYEAMRKADFFVLPTLNENFGHAIIEALAQGTPVIISDQTPWNDLGTFGAGWVVPLSDERGWKDAIRDAMNLSSDDYAEMSAKALDYVRQKFDFDEIRDRYLNLFRAD